MDRLGKQNIARLTQVRQSAILVLGLGLTARQTQTILAVQALYGLAMCASKWSILWMLKRIFIVRTFHVCFDPTSCKSRAYHHAW